MLENFKPRLTKGVAVLVEEGELGIQNHPPGTETVKVTVSGMADGKGEQKRTTKRVGHRWFEVDPHTSSIRVKFQHGDFDPEHGPNGVNVNDLLDFLIDFLASLDERGARPDPANATAIGHLESAAMTLIGRLRDRRRRGVLGRRDR